MKIGLLAYSTDTGLGNQTLEFYNHMNPAKVLIADLSRLNHMETHHERYGSEARIDPCISPGYLSKESCEWLVDGMDIVFVCETPLNYYIYEYAREKGVKVVQQLNYEFLDYFRNAKLPPPSVFAMPSAWGYSQVKNLGLADVVDLPVPINRKRIPFREISELKTFVHIIGRPAVHDRNGTLSFLKAAEALGSQFNYRIYLQPPTDTRAREYFNNVRQEINRVMRYVKIDVITDVEKYEDLYATGDVLVLPRRYGGLCLPMQEALSAGMPVIMTDIVPNRTRLLPEWLVSARKITNFRAHTDVDVYDANVPELISTMMKFTDKDYMRRSNLMANNIASDLSWDEMTPEYMDILTKIIEEKKG